MVTKYEQHVVEDMVEARPVLPEADPLLTRGRMGRQRGALVLDLGIWAAGIGVAVLFFLGIKALIWPRLQGWQEATSVSDALTSIQSVYGGAANYTGLTTAVIATPNIFEAKFLPGGGLITNRFQGTVTVSPVTLVNNNDTLEYSDGGLTSGACSVMVNDLASDADKITVAGTVVKAIGGNIDPAGVQTQCNSANTVTVLVDKIKQT